MAYRYNRNEIAFVYWWNYNWGTETLVDCDDGYPKITITDPSGNTVVNAVAMTKVDDGTYRYGYTLAADAARGWWNVLIHAQTDALPTIVYDGFEVL